MTTARVLFLGQKWLGDRAFARLVAAPGLDVRAAVTNTTADVWWGTRGVFDHARATAIPVLANDDRGEEQIAALIRKHAVDLILSVQHPWILSEEILDLVEGRAYNVHSARLPDLGGHNACNHAILQNHEDFTVTAHRMTVAADAGDVVSEETFSVPEGIHARALYDLALAAGDRLVARLLAQLAAGAPLGRRVVGEGGCFYTRGSLDELRDVTAVTDDAELERRVRALYFPPFEPAYRTVRARRVYLLPAGFESHAQEFAG